MCFTAIDVGLVSGTASLWLNGATHYSRVKDSIQVHILLEGLTHALLVWVIHLVQDASC